MAGIIRRREANEKMINTLLKGFKGVYGSPSRVVHELSSFLSFRADSGHRNSSKNKGPQFIAHEAF